MTRKILLVAILGLLAGCQVRGVRESTEPEPKDGSMAPEQDPTPSKIPEAGAAPRQITGGSWTRIGLSAQGRPILAATLGQGPLRILLVGGIHGNETEGQAVFENLDSLVYPQATLVVIKDINPDGTQAHNRTNSRGVDLNRNWPASNFHASPLNGPKPLSEPETLILNEQILLFRPTVIVVIHSSPRGPFVNFDGAAATLAQAFVHRQPDWAIKAHMGYETPGSLGSYLGVDQGLPIITVEFKRGQDPASAIRALDQGLQGLIQAKVSMGGTSK